MKTYIVLCVFLMFHACGASDPYCRSYEYDEKMLSKMIRNEMALESLTKGMESLQADIDTKLQALRNELETVKTKRSQPSPAGPIGFTVRTPDPTKSKNNLLIFEDVLINVGDGFNKDTGKFTCKQPGLYYFSLVIFRNAATTSQGLCNIMVNEMTSEMFAAAQSKNRLSQPTGSANLLVQLAEGDEVNLGICFNIDLFHPVTHFSGFLVN